MKAYTSAAGTRFWRGEFRTYALDGKAKHHSPTWRQEEYSKQQAQEELDALVRRETRGGRLDGSTTLRDYWERTYWPIRREHLAPNSQSAYVTAWNNRLQPLHGIALAEVTRHDVDAAIVALAKGGASASTCRQALHLISSVLDEAHQNALIPRNPARGVKVPRSAKPEARPRALTEQEAQLVLSCIGRAERPLWALLCLCGLRPSEGYALMDTDLLPGRRLLVERQTHWQAGMQPTKNRKARVVPVPPRLWADLQEIARARPGLLFPAADGRPRCINRHESQMRMRAAREATGIPDLSYRMCRTTFATLYQGDIADAQATLGHATAEFTAEHYRRPIEERQRREADALEDRLAPRLRRVK